MRKAYINPADLHLIVGRNTVAKLAPQAAAVAVNASYFDPASMAIWSNVAQGGKVLGDTGKPHPWLGVKSGKAFFGRGSIDPSAVDWAAGAGPMLLAGGQKAPVVAGENYGSDIVPGGETVPVQRMAMGVTADGRVCLLTLKGTFGDLRKALLEAGCVDAMNLDGGSSAQWVEHGQVVEGSSRIVVNALVADRVLTAAPAPARPFRVFVSASHQLKNLGEAAAFGGSVGYCEGYAMQQYALAAARALSCEVQIPGHDDDLATVCRKSNAFGADLFAEWHSNACDSPAVKGCEIYVLALGGRAEKFARVLQAHIGGTVKTANFQVLRDTDAPAVLIELTYHTNPDEVLRLMDPNTVATVAKQFAAAVEEYRQAS